MGPGRPEKSNVGRDSHKAERARCNEGKNLHPARGKFKCGRAYCQNNFTHTGIDLRITLAFGNFDDRDANTIEPYHGDINTVELTNGLDVARPGPVRDSGWSVASVRQRP